MGSNRFYPGTYKLRPLNTVLFSDGNKMPGILPKLAQYEITLLDWIEANRGAAQYVAMANKCWPAFQTEFGFVPCYVNSRLTARGIPVRQERGSAHEDRGSADAHTRA